MARKKTRPNRALTIILIIMTTILLLLLAIVFVNSKILNDSNVDSNIPQTEGNSDLKDELPADNTSEGSEQLPDTVEGDEPLPDDTVEGDEHTSVDNVGGDESLPADTVGSDPSEDVRPIVLAFAGDVNLDEDSKPVARYDIENKGILGGISQELVDEMNDADIFMLNNEFSYSTRGNEIIEKSYTFRAHPSRVDILMEMGVDIVSLANNHALDFGEEALLDTFTTLEEAGIDYVGAGINMDRAKTPIYYSIGDTTIAYVAASHVIYAMDWYATDKRPGMIGTYDPALFVSSIKEAKKNSDFVVVYVHWGKERVHEPLEYQKNLAKIYIDAGADAVIGCHPHVMQGIEFYKGKTIAYSLGNYWFNNASKRESGLLKIYINPDGSTDTQLLPAMNDRTYTYLITEEKARGDYFKFMEDISFDVEFDEKGFIFENE